MVKEALARTGMKYDPTISLGSIVTLLSLLAAMYGYFSGQATQAAILSQRLASIEEKMRLVAADHDDVVSLKTKMDRLDREKRSQAAQPYAIQ